MLNPFDSEFLSQELRETWKKVEELEEENKELKKENEELRELLEKERELYYGDDDFVEDDWGRE